MIWTLSYEMVFYLLVTALFATGVHRRSSGLAAAFGAGALLLGGLLPTTWLSDHTFGPTPVALGADILVLSGLAIAVITRGRARLAGAWLAAGTGLILVVMNERRSGYEGLTILALMFTGTLLYRAQHRQVSRLRATAITAGVFAAAIAAGAWHIPALATSGQPALLQREWVTSVALAGLTFAVGLGLQKRRVPPLLARLGLISYSVYLVFPLLLDLYDSIPFPPSYQHRAWLQVAMSVVFLAALLGCSAASYHYVEAPMQRLGRRISVRLDARFGPDNGPEHVAPAATNG